MASNAANYCSLNEPVISSSGRLSDMFMIFRVHSNFCWEVQFLKRLVRVGWWSRLLLLAKAVQIMATQRWSKSSMITDVLNVRLGISLICGRRVLTWHELLTSKFTPALFFSKSSQADEWPANDGSLVDMTCTFLASFIRPLSTFFEASEHKSSGRSSETEAPFLLLAKRLPRQRRIGRVGPL